MTLAAGTIQLLQSVQQTLHALYDLETNLNVTDFVLCDRSVAHAVSNTHIPEHVPEQLLIQQQDDLLNVSLYLDESLLARLHKRSPTEHLGKDNLSDYWIVVEGVSHFVYLAWNARFDRPVSLLELELQAEVDKYVCTCNLMTMQGQAIDHSHLWNSLFKNCRYFKELSDEQLVRYRCASHYAGIYCESMKNPQSRLHSACELRRFYRFRQNEKIDRIEQINQ